MSKLYQVRTDAGVLVFTITGESLLSLQDSGHWTTKRFKDGHRAVFLIDVDSHLTGRRGERLYFWENFYISE